MLIRATATFEVGLARGRALMLAAGELADLPAGLAREAIAQGTAAAADAAECWDPTPQPQPTEPEPEDDELTLDPTPDDPFEEA
jgi:hypothetical protein